MKKLFIIRHAKSSLANFNQEDFDRPLHVQGVSDANAMAKRLLDKQGPIDLFISSPALRAISTAKLFATVFGVAEQAIQREPSLYHASPDRYYPILSAIPSEINSVAIFSHNPGITQFVNELTNTEIDAMPTCGLFAVNIYSAFWNDFELAKKSFDFFLSPRQSF